METWISFERAAQHIVVACGIDYNRALAFLYAAAQVGAVRTRRVRTRNGEPLDPPELLPREFWAGPFEEPMWWMSDPRVDWDHIEFCYEDLCKRHPIGGPASLADHPASISAKEIGKRDAELVARCLVEGKSKEDCYKEVARALRKTKDAVRKNYERHGPLLKERP